MQRGRAAPAGHIDGCAIQTNELDVLQCDAHDLESVPLEYHCISHIKGVCEEQEHCVLEHLHSRYHSLFKLLHCSDAHIANQCVSSSPQ